jgi:hypothetical protein
MKKVVIILLSCCALVKASAQTGIGTTAPVNKLQIEATTADPATTGSSANGNLRLSGTGASHVLDFGLSSTSNFSWLQARSKSNYSTNYNLLLNPNGGQVSIGNTSPLSTLTVGNAGGTIGGEIVLNPTSTQYEGGQITIKKSLVGSTVDWTIDQYGSTSSNARFRIFNGNSEMNGLSILENGNIGLGTANPTAKLNLDGGGIRIATGFNNSTNRPGLNAGNIGNYEIRGVGTGGTGSAQNDGGDDGFLRLSAGGGTNTSAQSSIDISGFSNVADMTNTIVMRTSGSERVRINTNGYFGIGTSSPARKLHVQTADQTSVYIESTTSDNNGMMILNANTNQNWANGWHEFLMFQNQGNTIGQVVQTNASTINYATTSDYRLKTDFKSFKGLDIVNKIKTYDYAWKIDSSRMYGVKAHELQQVLPYLVSGKKDEVDKDGKLIPQTVDYGKLTPILVKAIQEQDSVIKDQGAQIQNLKREKEMIEKRLSDMELIIKKIVKKQTS